MTTFANAVTNSSITNTTNGMVAYDNTGDKVVDLFYNIGSSRSNPYIVEQFMAAYGQSPLLALKCLFWARDVRGGAGEREVFRQNIRRLEVVAPDIVIKNMHLIPHFGRWDDLLHFQSDAVKNKAFSLIRDALIVHQDALCAKWMPRKGPVAAALRTFLCLQPKMYRKLLVNLSDTVEQKLCAHQYTDINYEHVPSVAASRYQETFGRHDPSGYTKYRDALTKGEAKINASVVFPHDVCRGLTNGKGSPQVASAQWEALPNYIGNRKILPVSDVSASMLCPASGSVTCMDISIALGLYIAGKNTGSFKDIICTFHSTPELLQVSGDLATKYAQLRDSSWGGSTNIQATFDLILNRALEHSVPKKEMPEIVIIMSDMQFNEASGDHFGQSATQLIKSKYEAAGYDMPGLVFWNLNAEYGNVPSSNQVNGIVMISGFSPAIMSPVLACDFDSITPQALMLKVLLSDRYEGVTL